MVQLHIVSSSHSYHNCKIPFLYEHLMTPFMTRRRRRLLIPIIHLITRIYHAYCLLHQSSSPSIRIPYQSRSSRARVTVARPRSPVFLRPLLQSKSFYIVKLLYSRQWALFACTLYIMYDQTVVFVLVVPIPPTLPSDSSYYSLRWPGPLFIFFPFRT